MHAATEELKMTERRRLERHRVSNSLEVFDLDTGDLLGKVVDLHVEGLMLLSERPLEMFRPYALQVNLPMNLNGMTEFMLDAETMWRRESIAGGQFWTGLHFTRVPEDSRRCIERMVASR